MSVFSAPDYDDHEQVLFFNDAASGLKAIIALHYTGPGLAGGGCRMWPYATEAEALSDVLRLSRAMTYKLALARIPIGGGKTVIIGDPRRDKSEALLLALGRCVDSLGGRYIVGEDVGITVDDMTVINRETPHVVGLKGVSGDTSPPTAYGVYLGIRAAVARRLGRDDLEGVRVAVQGVGSVGLDLCRRLSADGAKLAVADLDAAACARARDELGATVVGVDEIYDLEVDVFAPCALGAVINDDTVPRLRAAIVAGAANNQLAEDRHGVALAERGILYAPDYVINAGGAHNASRERGSYDRDEAYRAIEGIPEILIEIFTRAEREGVPTSVAADRMARERIAEERIGQR
ncbi:MAG: Glu/Leu/Phe/Val dehydrogenase dimerization domain-containing protein [Alphaproteobacteria bacterium]